MKEIEAATAARYGRDGKKGQRGSATPYRRLVDGWNLVGLNRLSDRLSRGDFNLGHEAISDARDGLDVLLAGGLLAERLPQHRHVVIEIVLFDSSIRPDGLEQLLLGDEAPGVLDQHDERVEHLQPKGNDLGAA